MASKEESNAYSRGYAAGRRRRGVDYSRELADWRRTQFKQQVAIAVLPILAAPGSNWGTTKDGAHVKYSSMDDYARAAFQFAEKVAAQTSFSGARFELPKEDA